MMMVMMMVMMMMMMMMMLFITMMAMMLFMTMMAMMMMMMMMMMNVWLLPFPKFNSSPLQKVRFPKGQTGSLLPSIHFFRGYVKFWGVYIFGVTLMEYHDDNDRWKRKASIEKTSSAGAPDFVRTTTQTPWCCKAAERPRLLVPLQSVLGLKALCDSVGTWVEIGICRECGRFWGVLALVRCNIMRLSFAHSACDGAAGNWHWIMHIMWVHSVFGSKCSCRSFSHFL